MKLYSALSSFRLLFRLAAPLMLCAILGSAFFISEASASTTPVQDRYAPFLGQRVHYTNQGAGPDAVVFIHGWSCDASFWQDQAQAVAAGRRVLAVDLIGFGKSDAPQREYTQDLLAESVAAVLNDAGVRRAVLVGHSMGLAVSKRFMERHPGRAVGLFIVDGAYVDLPKDQMQVEGFKVLLNNPLAQTPDGWREFVRGFVAPMLVDSTPPAAREKVLASMLGTPRHVALSSMLNFLDPESWNNSPVNVPVKAVYATSQLEGQTPRPYLAKVFPQLSYEQWDNTGHFIMFDQSGRLTSAIKAFVHRVMP